MIVILLFKSVFHTHGMKAESITIILCRYVFHTLVFTVRKMTDVRLLFMALYSALSDQVF